MQEGAGDWKEMDTSQMEDTKNQERVISRIAHNPLVCYRAHTPTTNPASHPTRPPRNIQEAIARLDEIEKTREQSSQSTITPILSSPHPSSPLLLISGLLASADEAAVHAELDRLCPPLATSKSLEDKAFRVVTSLHVDVCMVDAEYCAALGKWAVKGKELLTEVDTEELIEGFEVPP
ncbi:hypothetical protein EON65_45480 [archaeon]|nr:MAG: hypothetical protein EON65_45480 [archaeon]